MTSAQNNGRQIYAKVMQWMLSSELWLSIFIGVVLGFYFSAFQFLIKNNFPDKIEPTWSILSIKTIIICLCVSWISWLITKLLLRTEQTTKKKFSMLVGIECLLLIPCLGLFFYSFFGFIAQGMDFTVLGWIKVPWQKSTIFLPPQGYLLLLWAGPWLVLNWIIKFILLTKGLLNNKSLLEKKNALVILFGSALLFYIGLGLWTTTVYPPTGDEPHYLLMTHSIIVDSDIDLENQMSNKDYQSFYPVENLDFHATPTSTGKLISKHFPLLSILLTPFYLLAGRFGAVFFIMCIASSISVVLFKLSQQWRLTNRQALYVWAFSTLSVPLGIYFDLIYTELPAILMFLIAIYFWMKNREQSGIILASIASFLPWLYPKFALLSLVLGALLLIRKNIKIKELIIPLAIIVLSAIGYYLFFNHYYSFSIADNPYGSFQSPFSIARLKNVLGLWVDRDFGMFATLPAILFSVSGYRLLDQKYKKNAKLAFWVFGLQYLLYCIFDDFTGSAAVFSRHMLPAVFLLFPMIILGWEQLQLHNKLKKYCVNGLMLYSIMMTCICSALPFFIYLAPKIKLYSKLGFSPSLFPGLADGASGYELIWGVIVCLIFLSIVKWLFIGVEKGRAC